MGNGLPTTRAGAERAAFECVTQGQKGEEKLRKLLDALPREDNDENANLPSARTLLCCKDQYGRTPLLVACLAGNVGAAQLLLQRGASTAVRASNGWTVLHYACALRRDDHSSELVALLMSYRADPLARDAMGQTPAHVSQFNGRAVALRHLESKACDFAGTLKLEVPAHANWTPKALRGGGTPRTAWRMRWIAITRLRGSKALARAPRLRCPRCSRTQLQQQAKGTLECGCGQLLLAPAPPREVCDALAVYADNTAATPEAVVSLRGCSVELAHVESMTVVRIALGPGALEYTDPVYSSRPASVHARLKRARTRLCAKESGVIVLGSADPEPVRLAYAALSRSLRTCPEPGALGDRDFEVMQSGLRMRGRVMRGSMRSGNDDDDVPVAAVVESHHDGAADDDQLSSSGAGSESSERSGSVSAGKQARAAAPVPQTSALRRPDWACGRCSLENPGKFENCQMCRRPRPALHTTSSLSSPSPSSSARGGAEQSGEPPPSAPEPDELDALALAAATAASARDAEAGAPLVCPLSGAPLRDPVITADGQTFERSAIEAWFAEGHDNSPLTGEKLASTALLPNLALRALIQKRQAHAKTTTTVTEAPAPLQAV